MSQTCSRTRYPFSPASSPTFASSISGCLSFLSLSLSLSLSCPFSMCDSALPVEKGAWEHGSGDQICSTDVGGRSSTHARGLSSVCTLSKHGLQFQSVVTSGRSSDRCRLRSPHLEDLSSFGSVTSSASAHESLGGRPFRRRSRPERDDSAGASTDTIRDAWSTETRLTGRCSPSTWVHERVCRPRS